MLKLIKITREPLAGIMYLAEWSNTELKVTSWPDEAKIYENDTKANSDIQDIKKKTSVYKDYLFEVIDRDSEIRQVIPAWLRR